MIHFNDDNELIKDIFNYDVIILWMDINNAMNDGFLKYVDVNFPELKKIEIKSGYGDTRKKGTINEIKTNNLTFCIAYVYENNKISDNLLEKCSFLIIQKYNNKKIASVTLNEQNKIIFNIFNENNSNNNELTIYNKNIENFYTFYYKQFLTYKTKYKNNEITKQEYNIIKNKLKKEQNNGIYNNT